MVQNFKTPNETLDSFARLGEFYSGVISVTVIEPYEDVPAPSGDAEIFFSFGDNLGGIAVEMKESVYNDFLDAEPEDRAMIMQDVFNHYHPQGEKLGRTH